MTPQEKAAIVQDRFRLIRWIDGVHLDEEPELNTEAAKSVAIDIIRLLNTFRISAREKIEGAMGTNR